MVLHSSPTNVSIFVQSPPGSSSAQAARDQMVLLPPDFVPGNWDVLCQRGKDCFEHVGNKRFRECVDKHIEIYLSATTRQEKSSIVSNIFDAARGDATQPHGGFVKKDLLTRRWYKISEKEARDKVGQALRDAIKTIRLAGKSTTMSKSTSSGKEVRAEHQERSNAAALSGMMVKTPIVGDNPSEVSKKGSSRETIDFTNRSSMTEKKLSVPSNQAMPPQQFDILGQGMLETRIGPLGLSLRQSQDEGTERKVQWSNAPSVMDNKGIPDNNSFEQQHNLGKRSRQMMNSNLQRDPSHPLANVMEHDARGSRRRVSFLGGYSGTSLQDFFPFDDGQVVLGRGESLLSQAAAASYQTAQDVPSAAVHYQQPRNMLQMEQIQNLRASFPSTDFLEPRQKTNHHFAAGSADLWGDLEPDPLPNPDFQIDLARTA